MLGAGARKLLAQAIEEDNCQIAVSVSVATVYASLLVAYRLYVPEKWFDDKDRCNRAGIPEAVAFQTKPGIALEQLRALSLSDVPRGAVLADAGYGNETEFRKGVRSLQPLYALGITKTTLVWPPGMQPLPPRGYSGFGRPPKLPRRNSGHTPVNALQLARDLPEGAYRSVAWREGTNKMLSSRFTAVRVREGHRYYRRSESPSEEWLLIEWPDSEPEPTKYWLSNLGAEAFLEDLVNTVKLRWRIERDYQELKQEIGLGHFEGRGWRGFRHHATLCIAAYGFLIAERSSFPPSGRNVNVVVLMPLGGPDACIRARSARGNELHRPARNELFQSSRFLFIASCPADPDASIRATHTIPRFSPEQRGRTNPLSQQHCPQAGAT